MQESQTVEWKWTWRDEYLKWLCGYANTDGGTLYVGVNDDGYVVGLKDSASLLERLPNKINDKLGILVSMKVYTAQQGTNVRFGNDVPQNIMSKLVNQYVCGLLCTANMKKGEAQFEAVSNLEEKNPIWFSKNGNGEYIEISVQSYPFAISCDGKYFKRSGSVLRELNGLELQNFLLEKAGKTWDDVPIPGVCAEELSRDALDAFRKKATAKKRIGESGIYAPDEELLRSLKLYNNAHLVRAALLMFHPDPEQYVTGAYIKIAYFAPAGAYGQNKVDDIIYSDDIHGPLMTQVDRAIELLYTKYLKALISYEGLQRVETFPWPKEAFREVLLNAVNHKAYDSGIPIQIRVYDDKITIWNDGKWPDKIEVAKIFERHPSVPHNPKIADVFYRSGEIESWGSGFEKIKMECDRASAPYPIIHTSEAGGVELICNACDLYMKLSKYGRYYETFPEEERTEKWALADADGMPLLADADSVLVSESVVPANPLPKETKKSIDRMMEILSKKLSSKEKEKMLPIVEYLMTHDEIEPHMARKLTGKSRTTVFRYMQRLKELDVIEEKGDSVSTVYKRK